MKKIFQPKVNDLSAFAAFLSVASHRNFRSAAKDLEITPSAISHSIKALEKKLNVRLFNRTTRSVSLTDVGERLALKLMPAVASIEEALRELEDNDHVPAGTVRINASEGAIRLVLLPVLARFLRENPLVNIDIFSDGKLSDIVADGFDVGFRLADAVPKDMVAIPVTGDIRFAVVASSDYFAAHGYPKVPTDLYGHNCIRFRFESGAIYKWEFEHQGTIERIDVSGALTLSDQPLMVEAAINGVGIAFVPDHLAVKAINEGQLVRVLEEWCPAFQGLCLYYSANRHMPSGLRALIDTLTAVRL